jgi:hypothetical protein
MQVQVLFPSALHAVGTPFLLYSFPATCAPGTVSFHQWGHW